MESMIDFNEKRLLAVDYTTVNKSHNSFTVDIFHKLPGCFEEKKSRDVSESRIRFLNNTFQRSFCDT